MDNYDLSNLPLLGHSEDAGEHQPWLADEENRPATFLRRSVTVTTPEQVERQQLPSTSGEETSEQKTLTDFDISLAPNIFDPLIVDEPVVDEPVVDEPENPFAALAAYPPFTFDENSNNRAVSELCLGLVFPQGFTSEDLTDVVLTEPEWNDILESLEQSQSESDTRGIIIPESTIPDTVSGKHSRKRRASEPRSSIKESTDLYFGDSLRRSWRLYQKKQKLDSTHTESLPLPRATATRSHCAATPLKSTDSQKNTEQNPDESLKERVKRETAKWAVRLARGVEKRHVCLYPNCGNAYLRSRNLRMHIFKHIRISVYKCTYPECSDNPYFRDSVSLRRHVIARHTHEKPYHCTLCDMRLGRLDTYKRHVFRAHKLKL